MSADQSGSVTRRLHIVGRVQGVGYRAWCVHTARKLGLVGWVRNLTDGSVEAVARGPKEVLESFVAAAHAGPPGARVTEVNTTPATLADTDSFRQIATAAPGAGV